MTTITISYWPLAEIDSLALPGEQVSILERSIQDLRTIESNIEIEIAQVERSFAQIRQNLELGLHLNNIHSSEVIELGEQRRMQINHIKTIIAMITDPLDDEDSPFYQEDLGRQTRDTLYRVAFERKPEDPK